LKVTKTSFSELETWTGQTDGQTDRQEICITN